MLGKLFSSQAGNVSSNDFTLSSFGILAYLFFHLRYSVFSNGADGRSIPHV